MRKFLFSLIVVLCLANFNLAAAELNIRGPAIYGPPGWLFQAITANRQHNLTPEEAGPIEPENPNISPQSSVPAKEPTPAPKEPEPLPASNKLIFVSLKDQTLRYFEDTTIVGEFKISSGLKRTPTPPGEYTVLIKRPLVNYVGPDYNFPRTKWNLMFKHGTTLNYYIHGAYWHNKFGQPMSHGCVNVSYANMEGLYNWADVGTKITIE